MKVTLKTIAEEVGVSQSLVSKVLNNKNVRVSEEKKKDIIKVAQKYGYKTKSTSNQGEISRNNVLALFQPSLDFEFLVSLSNEIEKQAKENGYDIIIFNTHEDVKLERRYLEICDSYNVDGIIVNACDNQLNNDHFKWILGRGIPLIFVDRFIYDLNCGFVANDNFEGSYKLTKRLIEQGHRDILYLFHGESFFTIVQKARFEGYQAAMAENGLKCVKEIVYSERSLKYQPIFRAETSDLYFTAIVLSTTWDFMKLLDLLDEMLGNQNSKVDLAAFDTFSIPFEAVFNNRVFKHINNDLLIIEQDVNQMGKKVVNIMIDMIKNKKLKEIEKKVFIKPKLKEYSFK